MTIEEFQILTHDKIQDIIESNLYEDSANFALKHRNNELPTLLVSQQLKYLQKSRKKIPTFYQARCIVPPLAFEQASSEQSAAMKSFSGDRCLDLSCGLGVDVAHFARHFQWVDAVDIDPLKIEVGTYNFQKMGLSHVGFHCSSSEEYLSNYSGLPYDLVYIDPARRDEKGNRTYAPEHCQPNVFELMPLMLKHAKKVLIKLSPMYDHVAALRQFKDLAHIHIYSVDNECKEVLVELVPPALGELDPRLQIKCYRSGNLHAYEFEIDQIPEQKVMPEEIRYIWYADVAFYKGRVLRQLYQKYFSAYPGIISHSQGFFFSDVAPPDNFPGSAFRIRMPLLFKPKSLRKQFKRQGIKRAEIIQRNFPHSVQDIRKQLNLEAGGDTYLLATQFAKDKKLWICDRIP